MYLIWVLLEVSWLSKTDLKWKIKQKAYNMEIQGVRRNSIPDDPQEIFRLYDKFIDIEHRDVCEARYINDESVESIAEKKGKSVATINNWLNKFTDELAFRSYAVLVEKGNFTKDSSIKGIFGLSMRGIQRLEDNGIHTFGELEETYVGCTEKSLKISSSFLSASDRRYILLNHAILLGETSTPAPSKATTEEKISKKPVFLILKELKSRYQGVVITNKGTLKVSYLGKEEAVSYNLINVESKIKENMLGDIPIAEFECLPRSVNLSKLREKGISKLSDFMKFTRSELEGTRYIGVQTISLIEEELLYRWGVGFKPQPVPTIKPSKNYENYVSVDELSERPLPNSFLLYTIGKCTGTCSDVDILNLYQDYLENVDREDDWLILQELRTRNSELPIGIISLMENVQNGVFPCGILSDKYGMQLLQCVIDFNSEKLTRLQKLCLQKMYNSLLADEDVNIKELISFCSVIDFPIPTNRLIYIYKNYRKDAYVFLKRPTDAGTLEEDGVRRLEKTYKGILQPTHLRVVTAYAERLNISYKYIIGKIDYYLNHKKEIGGNVPMLASWFKFDYRAMGLYLKENENFGS